MSPTRSLELQLNNALKENKSLWAVVDTLQEAMRKVEEMAPEGVVNVCFSQACREALKLRSPMDASKFTVYRITHRVLQNGDLKGIRLRSSAMNRPMDFGITVEHGQADPTYEVVEDIQANKKDWNVAYAEAREICKELVETYGKEIADDLEDGE